MIWKSLVLALSLSTSVAVAEGGDAVFCFPYALSTLKGTYSADFVATRKRDNRDLVRAASWEESRARLERELLAKFLDLGRSFAAFVTSLDNQKDVSRSRVWREAEARKVPIEDPVLLDSLTPNCYRNTEGKPIIFEVVTRRRVHETVVHEFDPDFFTEMRSNSPLQFSFLIVGEWLREWSSDIETVRRLNRFLHSNELEALSATTAKAAFANQGLSLKRVKSFPVCERTLGVRRYLEKLTGLGCDELSDRIGEPGSRLDLSGRELASLENGDFASMPTVAAISLRQNQLKYLPEEVFAGLSALEELDLRGNGLLSLAPETFRDLRMLRHLDLRENQLEDLPRDLFLGFQVGRVLLKGNRFSEATRQRLRGQVGASVRHLLFD